ncbi:MAG: energy transducer TonB family protein [Gemmatimonadaceae bacterium]
MLSPRHTLRWIAMAALMSCVACENVRNVVTRFSGPDTSPPDSLPRLLNDSLPFNYPVGLYLQLIDDSVTLRLHIDQYGQPVPESTRVEVPAKHPQFDTSAVDGSRALRFRPALRRGQPMAYTVLFPIQFKVPTVPVPPSDTTVR